MFFAKAGNYPACGIFSLGHFMLIILTLVSVYIALKYTVNKVNVKKAIRNCTIFVWIFEIVIITFKIIKDGYKNINNYVPMYFCSLLLYAGILSSFCKRKN